MRATKAVLTAVVLLVAVVAAQARAAVGDHAVSVQPRQPIPAFVTGAATSITFDVANPGALDDTYDLLAFSSDPSVVVTSVPASVAVPAAQVRAVVVTVDVGGTSGQAVSVTLAAVSTGDPAVSEEAAADGIVGGGVGSGPGDPEGGPAPTGTGGRPQPQVRGFDQVCPPGSVPAATFLDLDAASTHRGAVECLAWKRIVSGRTTTRFDPTASTTRGETAAFLARVLASTGFALPAGSDRFSDDESSVHERDINALAALEVVAGFADGTFRPTVPLSRAQMASVIAGVVELLRSCPAEAGDYFGDDEGSVHEPGTNCLAASGLAGGTGPEVFGGTGLTTRAQMASFLARLLDLLTVA